jgi:hypothetical protein
MKDFTGCVLGFIIIGIIILFLLQGVGMLVGEVLGTCDSTKVIYYSTIDGSPIDECVYNANVFRMLDGK